MSHEPTAKRVNSAGSSSSATMPSGGTSDTTHGMRGSFKSEAAVPYEVQAALETVGMQSRFNVSRGYRSPPVSSAQPFANSIWQSNRDTLDHVKTTRSAWSRTQSAPVNELQPYSGVGRHFGHEMQPLVLSQEAMQGDDEAAAIFQSDLKRARGDDVLGDLFNEEQDAFNALPASSSSSTMHSSAMDVDDNMANRTVQALPRLGARANGLNRGATQTMPTINSSGEEYTQFDFSTHAKVAEF